jgi:integrase
MKLTNIAISKAKPTEKTQKLFDGGGLFLEVTPKGAKRWRFKYRFGGKEKLISLGIYPEISLKDARVRHLEARKHLAQGIDPSEVKKVIKSNLAGEYSFKNIALEWVALKSPGWSPSHREKTLTILEKDIFPYLGDKQIDKISSAELLVALKRIDTRSNATARKAFSACKQVFIHAIPSGKIVVSPAEGLHNHLAPRIVKHMAAPTTQEETARLLRAIDTYHGSFIVHCALKLSPLLFVRPGTLRTMEWKDIDFGKAEWRIPIEQLKRRQVDKLARPGEVAHIVPLCRQAILILQELNLLTGGGKHVFPAFRHKAQCISNNTVRSALRGMGFTSDDITPHGFRHMASTHLHELGYPSLLIEKQLAHSDRNSIRAVYNHAEYLPERRLMMQAWADYLDGIKRDK